MLRLRPRPSSLLLLVLLSPAAEAAAQDASEDGFAHPELLVSTAWIAEHGGDPGVVVVDVREVRVHEAGHVPGAVGLPSAATYDPKTPGGIGSHEQIAGLLGARGITPANHVVLYDEGRSIWAARVFWTLEVLGHARVSVLDGGFAKWTAEKRPTTTDVVQRAPVEYASTARPERLSTTDRVLEDVGVAQAVLLDARSQREYEAGRIPGAVRIEWTESYTTDEVPVFRSPAELRKLYADRGVTPDKRVHAY